MTSIRKTHFHARSVSFPSRSTQFSEFDDLEATTSTSSISQEISGLTNLYGNAIKAVQNECVNELLDELLGLLELCSTAKDALLMTRDSARQLQSVLRRKRGDSIELSVAIQEYQSKRKAVKKAIVKALRQLKGSSIKKTKETPLREVESVTLTVLESLLCFILGSSSPKNSNKWSLVSKLVGQSDESSERSQVRRWISNLRRNLLA